MVEIFQFVSLITSFMLAINCGLGYIITSFGGK